MTMLSEHPTEITIDVSVDAHCASVPLSNCLSLTLHGGSDMNVKPALIMMMLLAATVVGCESSEGPAERAGKQIDQAAEKAGDTIDEAVEKTGEKIEEAGDAIREKTDD